MFGKFGAKIEEALGILKLLPTFYGDFKATMAVIQHDIADLKAGQAILTHRATVAAVTSVAGAQAGSLVPPLATPAPAAPAAGAGGIQAALQADVAAVKPLEGVKLP